MRYQFIEGKTPIFALSFDSRAEALEASTANVRYSGSGHTVAESERNIALARILLHTPTDTPMESIVFFGQAAEYLYKNLQAAMENAQDTSPHREAARRMLLRAGVLEPVPLAAGASELVPAA